MVHGAIFQVAVVLAAAHPEEASAVLAAEASEEAVPADRGNIYSIYQFHFLSYYKREKSRVQNDL